MYLEAAGQGLASQRRSRANGRGAQTGSHAGENAGEVGFNQARSEHLADRADLNSTTLMAMLTASSPPRAVAKIATTMNSSLNPCR